MPGTAQAPEQRLPVHHYRRRSTVGPARAWARAARILTRKGLEVRLPQPASAGSSQLRPGGQVDDQGLEASQDRAYLRLRSSSRTGLA